MLYQFALDQLLWTGRLALAAVILIWIKRATVPYKPDPHLHPRIELWMDLLLALMICSWGTYLIRMCDPWNNLTSYIEASRLMQQYGLSTEGDDRDVVRPQYRLGISLGHLIVHLSALPVFLALKKRQDAHLRASV